MTDENAQYLIDAATRAGINPLHLATAIRYESSNNPNIWGGKNGNYYGLIQFGPEERKKYGVVPGQTDYRGQVDAAINFLQDRGFKPGMGLLDLYSTINAGSPGHYNASDRPGSTVASHVQAMQSQMAKANDWLGGKFSDNASAAQPVQTASATPTTSGPGISSLLSLALGNQASPLGASQTAAAVEAPQGLLGKSVQDAQKTVQAFQGDQQQPSDAEYQAWLKQFQMQHARAAGLLGEG